MELDYQRPNDMTCVTDIEKQRKRIAEDRVYMFLAGLDHSLDQVSSRVLTTFPLPSLEEAYSPVCREVQRQVTMGTEDHSEASALAVQKSNSWPTPSTPSTDSSSRFYTHCNSTRHTVDVCWKKHGYLEWLSLSKRREKTRNLLRLLSSTLLFLLLLTYLECLLKKDNLTKMTIGIGKERGGLYYLEGARELESEHARGLQMERETSDREKIL